jgi:uncharacterized repeat protein (TIGR04138 family)
VTDHVRKLALSDRRYAPEAYSFLFESLDHAVRLAKRAGTEEGARHVTGQELLNGMREYARRIFGPMGAQVWRSWGIHSSLDWGRVVFKLVEAELLKRQDSDTIDDFREGFDFDEYFVNEYEPELPHELGSIEGE